MGWLNEDWQTRQQDRFEDFDEREAMKNQVNEEQNTLADRARSESQPTGQPTHKIFCFNNGGSPGWYSAVAIADDGHCLAQHVCSHEGFMAHDLGVTSNWKHDNYNAHFGEGNWELVWVADPKNHAGLDAAYALNQELAAAKPDASAVSGDSERTNNRQAS